MPTIEEIETWREQQGLTRKRLAELLHVNYKALCPVLAGKRPLSNRLEASIEELMQNPRGGIQVAIPPEFEPTLTAWAEAAKIPIDRLVMELLADALKVKLPPRE